MVRKLNDQKVDVKQNMRGGNGEISMYEMLYTDEMYGKGRLFNRVVVKPGCSIGYHVHEGEMEAYFIVSGSGLYDDNGVKVPVSAGDITLTPSGEGHGIENTGTEDLITAALILYK